MCGIAGVVGPVRAERARIEATLGLMANRGPDATGVHFGRVGNAAVSLLHSRLSIIDLDSRADQPFVRDGIALVTNGEIYNYLELRAELEAEGHRFTTTSDTEVMLEAYRAWGADCVTRFNGMWAFALLDQGRDRLLLSRDRFGEKPLYYMEVDGAVYFGSEVKFISALSGRDPEVDKAQVARYLVGGYRTLYQKPRTWFERVHELPAAHNAEMGGPSLPRPEPYWSLHYRPAKMSLDDAVEGTREQLSKAVSLRLRADVPLAFCLSGGVDSASLVALAASRFGCDVHAFSVVDSDERYNETANIAATVDAHGCRSDLVQTSRRGFFERMADLVAYHDAPVATISYYVHSFLSQAIHEHGYKIAISGTAADELFTGYYDHYLFWLAEQHGRPDFDHLVADWRAGMGAAIRNPELKNPLRFVERPLDRSHLLLDNDLFAELMRDPPAEPFEEQDYAPSLLRNRMLNELTHESVPVILREDDLNSMRYSVENRSPFLDHRLAEFAFSIPNEHLIGEGYAKLPLRRAMHGLVPEQVRLDKEKKGFNASITSLVDLDDPDTVERLLAPGPIFEIVDRDSFAAALNGLGVESNSVSKFLFSFISARLFMERPGVAPTVH